MSKYDSYFLMKADEVPAYVQEKLSFFPADHELESKEIGDGNLNYVFRVKDKQTGKSIIIKQAGESLRISEEMKLSTDRGRIEAEILGIQGKFAPGLVPEVYLYDSVMCCMLMEDMVGHTMMRTGLINHETYPLFSEHISTFLVNSLLQTTDVVTPHKEKKENVKNFINPDLCEISEDLVFTEPYNDCNNRNNVFPPIADFVKTELYDDKKLHVEVAKYKFNFMNNAQSLVHGDLHTGSIFINQEHTYVFDPEFAFFGPMGYDIGNVLANMFFAWANGDAVIEDSAEKEKFCGWVIKSNEEIVDKFKAKFIDCYDKEVNDLMAKTEDFRDWYLSKCLADTAACAGLEMIRRLVGMANVKDITTIADEAKRARAEKVLITLGKDLIMNRNSFMTGADYVNALNNAIKKIC